MWSRKDLPGVGVLDALGAEAIGGPLHVGEQVRGLHGGDDAFFFEAVEVAGEQDLGVFDAEAEGGGGWGALLGFGDDVGVGSRVRVALAGSWRPDRLLRRR